MSRAPKKTRAASHSKKGYSVLETNEPVEEDSDLPKDEAALWDWLVALDDSRRAALLAHCVSFGVTRSTRRATAAAVRASLFTGSSAVSSRPTASRAW